MDELSMQKLADELVGNWMKFESFAWTEAPDDGHLWCLIPLCHRDSDTTALPDSIMRRVQRQEGLSDIHIMRARHWAVGWMDHLAVKVKNEDGSITPDFQWFYKNYHHRLEESDE